MERMWKETIIVYVGVYCRKNSGRNWGRPKLRKV